MMLDAAGAGSIAEDVDSVEILGCRLARLRRDEVVDRVFAALAEGAGGQLITANVDHLRRFTREPEIRELFARADLVVADGVPLLWAARLRGEPLPERVAGSDLVWDLAARAAAEGRSLFLLGGNPGAAEAAAAVLRERWPALRLAGLASPMLSAEPDADELAALRSDLEGAQPDLVYVALGAPKQERVIQALRASLPGAWWVGVGISLSFISGEIQRAPVWVQRLGMEWLHRTLQEPGRLARRYLLEDLPFFAHMLLDALRQRRSA